MEKVTTTLRNAFEALDGAHGLPESEQDNAIDEASSMLIAIDVDAVETIASPLVSRFVGFRHSLDLYQTQK